MTTRPEPVTLAELIALSKSLEQALAYTSYRDCMDAKDPKKLARLEVAVNVRMRRLLDMLTKRQTRLGTKRSGAASSQSGSNSGRSGTARSRIGRSTPPTPRPRPAPPSWA